MFTGPPKNPHINSEITEYALMNNSNNNNNNNNSKGPVANSTEMHQ
jgi:hypothetical protein